MNVAMRLDYSPSELAYYTTWWLKSTPSTSFSSDDILVDRHRKKQVNIHQIIKKEQRISHLEYD
jgi:hypothetical protein